MQNPSSFLRLNFVYLFYLINFIFKMENKEELIIKKSYNFKLKTDCHLQFGDMKKEFRVIVDH